jgi:enoyl-CoA hydratase/carnithine racemase
MIDTPDVVVRYETRGVAAWLTIDRPESRNALTPGVVEGLHTGILRASNDAALRAVVLTAAGDKAFCAGADLKLAATTAPPDPAQNTSTFAKMLRSFMECPLPLVARVNGHCMAGGMGLLAMCDLAVAVDYANFGLPEVKIGLFPMQVLSILRAILGARQLAELSLTGEPIGSREALVAGLINYAVPASELDAKVEWLLARLVDKSPTAQRRGKFAMRAIDGMRWDIALPYLETQLRTLTETQDAREGRRAFVERRPPEWTGR